VAADAGGARCVVDGDEAVPGGVGCEGLGIGWGVWAWVAVEGKGWGFVVVLRGGFGGLGSV